jgi:hypothetical protein
MDVVLPQGGGENEQVKIKRIERQPEQQVGLHAEAYGAHRNENGSVYKGMKDGSHGFGGCPGCGPASAPLSR